MQAYAEGWELLEKVDLVDNVTEVFGSWREGTVIRSWLLDLLVAALDEDPRPRRDPRLRRGLRRGPVDRRGRASTTPCRCPAIAASLFARFVSRQDDSPAMKAVAAMRNQFGGHAVQHRAAARRRRGRRRLPGVTASVYVAHLTLHDFRSYADVDVALEPGRDGVRRPQRPGQDQPGRGDRLPLPARARTGSPPTRRWSGPAPSRRWCAPRWSRDGRTAVLEVEINPGRANRARVNRSPLPRARDLVGLVRTVVFSPEDLDPGQGRPVRAAPVPRRPAGAAHPAAGRRPRRLRPGARQRNSLLKTAGAARRGVASQESALSTLGGVGRPPRPAPAPSCSPTRLRAGRRPAALRRQGLRDRGPRAPRATTPRSTTAVVRAARRPTATGPRSTEALLAEVERRRNDELDRGVSLVGPHRDDLLLTLGAGRRRPGCR